MKNFHALIISNSSQLALYIEGMLMKDIPSSCCDSTVGNQALEALSRQPWNVIISDLTITEVTTLQIIDTLAVLGSDAELIVIQDFPSVIVDAIEVHALHKSISVTLTRSVSLVMQEIVKKSLSSTPPAKTLIDLSLASSVNLKKLSSRICLEQIVAYYQPQICLSSGEICGAEVLARWNHERQGILGPRDIFTVLNTTKLREALWEKMLINAACTLQHLQGRELNFAVNVCADVASSVEWAERLANFFTESTLDPKYLTVEITESPSEGAELWLSGTVAQLRLRHFHCAIDDFGTGFSSLQRLATTPFNKLKIDKSFIQRARSSPTGMKLLQSTVTLAHNLGLIVIAEGIETKEDFERVRELGIDIAQGYYFAKPMPLENFMTYINSYRTRLSIDSDDETKISFFL